MAEGLMPGASGGEELLWTGRPALIQGFGGLVLAITGAVVVARAGTWPAMSGRYQARAAAPADAWDAIERGQDPT